MDYQTVQSIHQRRVMPLIVPGHTQIAPNSVDFVVSPSVINIVG